MDAHRTDLDVAAIAAAIGDPARAQMLCSLLDGCARTATELAALADVGASTASGHFARLREQGLVEIAVQGKHRYYRLANDDVAAALEALLVVAGVKGKPFKPSTPTDMCHARTCYDHMAGEIGVGIHDRLIAKRFLAKQDQDYVLTPSGEAFMQEIGLDIETAQNKRRSFAKPCMDWSARRPHLGGALGAALLTHVLHHGWVEKDLDSRVLRVTPKGSKPLEKLFGLPARRMA
ncbi:helix-turn-helix transcriptional regulator [Alcaligenaceae bacterium A4P071]|nr:helix-turn-helix transcriptional regulator [Alcaligenaceae bacterium B3P038]MDQ2149040.1 helix-turn-helix transcriptional regulator [Alcaligenaceae bacterium C4P045]MDQ2186317.1 helix-turn-helix transcriptional regulator [Alcaligenaceae bacterium A4P071]